MCAGELWTPANLRCNKWDKNKRRQVSSHPLRKACLQEFTIWHPQSRDEPFEKLRAD